MTFVVNLGSWMSVVCEICLFLFLVLVDFVTIYLHLSQVVEAQIVENTPSLTDH